MRSSRSIFAFGGVLAAALATSGAVHAQATSKATLYPPNPDRYLGDGSADTLRPAGNKPYSINYDDCANKDINMVFSFTLAPVVTGGLQVWASANQDCTQPANRQLTTGGCNAISAYTQPLGQTMRVTVYARDIAWAAFQTSTSQLTYDPATRKGADVCSLQTGSAGSGVKLYFLLSSDQTQTTQVANTITYDILVDLVGPQAPLRAGSLGVGSQLLKVPWNTVTPPDQDLSGYRIFCAPPPGKENSTTLPPIPGSDGGGTTTTTCTPTPTPTLPDASDDAADADDGATAADSSTIADAGGDACVTTTTDGGTSTGGDFTNCPNVTSPFQDGQNGSAIPGDYICGTADRSTTEFSATGLTNGQTYTFAVGAYDVLLNTGPITVIGCDYPQAIDDFWDDYKNAGGKAGGSFCALEAPGAPAAVSIFTVAMGAAAAAFARRRRK